MFSTTNILSKHLSLCLCLIACAASLFGCGGSSSSGNSSNNTATVYLAARTGPIVPVRVGETAFLDGTKSTSSSPSEPLTYNWSFSSKPNASSTLLQAETTANASFVADVRGTYILQLVVSAAGVSSQRAIQTVVSTIPPEPPTGPFNHEGLSSNCVNCHNGDLDLIPGVSKLIGKSPDHLATSNLCQTCHSPLGFPAIPYVDHLEVVGSCSQCHNNKIAIGKSEFHVTTVGECDDCHNTTSFLELGPDGSYDHSNISRSCSGCHNGSISIGKTPSPPHPVTNNECGFCHTTTSFLGAYPDHTAPIVTAAINGCSTCHGNTPTSTARGEPVGHPVMAVDCAACHSIVTFSLGGVFNHRIGPPVQSCETCHIDNNSINARGKGSAPNAHPTTTLDCNICHDTVSFTNPSFDHSQSVVTNNRCDFCHGAASAPPNTPATGKPSINNVPPDLLEHLPTTDDCSVCHTPGTFATGTFAHTGVISGCTACHNDVISAGKPINHIPTNPDNQDCVACHTPTNTTNFTTFAGAAFGHVGINTNNCTLCHNNTISTGKPSNHLPTSLDCSLCHTPTNTINYTTFAGIAFNHLGIDPNNCAVCHNTGIATPKKANHIPVHEDCSVCHNSTSVFTPSTFLTTGHQNITNGCEGCHTSQFFPAPTTLIKSTSHLPTVQDCDVCHAVAGFTPSNFNHTGISGNCASCHNGNFVGINARGPTNSPVHQNTPSDCSACHNTTDFAAAFVDHTSPEVLNSRCDSCHNGIVATGKDAKANHVTTIEDCSVCHVPGAFAPAVFNHTGIVNNCASCHNGIDATGKDAKVNPAHIPTTDDCSVCHTPTAFANANFEHQGITNNCVTCHNGTTATGKANNHVPTNGDCVNCHQTTGFKPATFDHQGIVDNCSSCHDAGLATPKKVNHVATNQDCGVCHSPSGFIPATFDHTGIVNNCASCHGVTATGKTPNHLITGLDCSSCHTTATFVGGTWVHDSSTANNCDTCHVNNGGATPKPGVHLNTNEQCDVCHSTNGWTPTNFSHSPQGNYPGDHRTDPGCTGCHKGAIGAGINIDNYPSQLTYAPFCAGCHARDFERKGDHIGGENGTLRQNRDCSGGGNGCHRVSDRKFD